MIIAQINICLPDGVTEFVQGGREAAEARSQRRKSFLLEAATTVIQPVFANPRPKPCKFDEISLDPPLTIRHAPEIECHRCNYRCGGNQELELKDRNILRPL